MCVHISLASYRRNSHRSNSAWCETRYWNVVVKKQSRFKKNHFRKKKIIFERNKFHRLFKQEWPLLCSIITRINECVILFTAATTSTTLLHWINIFSFISQWNDDKIQTEDTPHNELCSVWILSSFHWEMNENIFIQWRGVGFV